MFSRDLGLRQGCVTKIVGRGSREEKFLVREVKGLRAQPELHQAFVQPR